MEDFDFDAEQPGLASVIGDMTAKMMDFAERQGLEHLTLAGVAVVGITSEGKQQILTRTNARDPWACAKMWQGALELELEGARRDTIRGFSGAAERIRLLEDELRLHGLDVPESE